MGWDGMMLIFQAGQLSRIECYFAEGEELMQLFIFFGM